MTEPMNRGRFAELAETYGGTIARWPASERDAARQLVGDPAAVAILAKASMLDDVLDTWRVPAPSTRVRDAISGGIGDRRVAARVRLWWSGIGIAAAFAGATAGAAAVALLAPVTSPIDATTSFGDITAQEG